MRRKCILFDKQEQGESSRTSDRCKPKDSSMVGYVSSGALKNNHTVQESGAEWQSYNCDTTVKPTSSFPCRSTESTEYSMGLPTLSQPGACLWHDLSVESWMMWWASCYFAKPLVPFVHGVRLCGHLDPVSDSRTCRSAAHRTQFFLPVLNSQIFYTTSQYVVVQSETWFLPADFSSSYYVEQSRRHTMRRIIDSLFINSTDSLQSNWTWIDS